jgi:dipeptidyl-peptidase-4
MQRAPLLLALCAALSQAPSLAAQGSAEQYERAARLRERLAGVVTGLDLGYRWSADGARLWFERLGADRTKTQHEVILATGEVVAAAPLHTVEADDPWALRLEPTRPRARSRRDGERVTLVFVNGTERALELLWVDSEGELRSYGTIPPGERTAQSTFAGHLWRCREDGTGVALGDLAAPTGGGVVFVDGAAKASARQPRDRDPSSSPERPPSGHTAGPRLDFREHDAWLVDGEVERRLTTDGAEDHSYGGRATFAPGGAHVVFFRERRGEHREVTLVESAPADQLQPRTRTFRYDKPGDRLDVRVPRVFAIATGSEVPLDNALFPDPWAIRDLHWTSDGARLFFVHVQRGHRIVKLIELDVRTGASRAVIDEQPATFFDYAHKLFIRHLEATDEVLWTSERSGWNHLWRVHRTTGVATPVTSGEWVVRSVEAVNEVARTARLRVMGLFPEQDPYHEHFALVHLDTGTLTPLTRADGTHTIDISPDGSHFVATWQRIDQPPVRELRRAADGALVTELSRADASSATTVLARLPERFVAKGRDGTTDIHGVLHWPSDFTPGVRYPVIEQIYAGPHGAHVPKTFDLDREAQRLAELGFVVVQIDGMGTNWRSKAFHDIAWRNLADSGFPDRIAWLRAAGDRFPELDLAHVGIFGGSAGGQSALRAVLDHADFYRAAAADCGCHDNRMDKVWWNELWMGWPVDDHYLASSNVEHAERLGGALLLTVGALDTNVDPSSTLQVVDALIRADKDFELIVFPRGGHGVGESPYGRRRRDDFFVRELHGVAPRWSTPPTAASR